MNYNFLEIEKKWQEFWKTNRTYQVGFSSKPKLYVLDMFPYPSGAGLHVGHPLGYIASDIYSRYKRHNGFNVLHPQGYDSFGLPAEQYAIKTGQHPKKTTTDNINMYRNQLDRIGFSFDWSREIRTSDPNYYKWTQWIFILMFNSFYCPFDNKAKSIKSLINSFEKEGDKKFKSQLSDLGYSFNHSEWDDFNPKKKSEILMNFRLAYLTDGEVNWCEELGTVLANDEIINGVSERGGYHVSKRKVKHWCLRISEYSERLLSGLERIDWPDPLKEMQRNWIGKSKGVSLNFKVENSKNSIEVFTTRPDTIFGVSFLTIAPEYKDISDLSSSQNKLAITEYISEVSKKSERDRLSDVKSVSGVFSGSYAIHPFNGKKVPIWVSDYVIASYGTGAVMGVPAGDQRDFDFAKKFQIDIPNIFKDIDISNAAFSEKTGFKLNNSEFLDGKDYDESLEIIINEIEKKNIGKSKVQYKLRDATFSRQRYWGEPIPIYYKDGIPQNIDPIDLPLKLPEVDNFLPTKNGDSPLGNSKSWAWSEKDKKVTSNDNINNVDTFPIELNTMPGWAGSSWYFYRYMDPSNNENFVSNDSQNYWSDIDVYFGGSEHATGHLLYSRFYQKFLYDLKFLNKDEYAKKLVNQGMILGNSAFVYRKSGTSEYLSKNLISDYKVDKIRIDIKYVNAEDQVDFDLLKKEDRDFKNSKFILENDKFLCVREQEKMSKSKFNVVNPDEICDQYGADTLRMYEMFLGPIEQSKPWDTRGISGVHSFLKKFWNLFYNDSKINLSDEQPSKEALKTLHKTIKKVSEDIEKLSLNTCISSFMICINELSSMKCNNRFVLENLLILISPFAPHFAEELWSQLGNTKSIVDEKYPEFEEEYLVESEKVYPVSFNGKTRFTLNLSLDLNHQEIEKEVLSHEKTKSILDNTIPKKIIIVPGKIINIVI
ncbi:MAG: leucine--tRNA ligase [Flavobacteriaceae bacterium]|nr:leucine--tRNA ligase [Flavobacteriaceae bacterium]